MEFERPNRFDKAFKRLSHNDRRSVERALREFAVDPLQSSLNTEKVINHPLMWSFRASGSLRCTFIFDGDLQQLRYAKRVRLSNVGRHPGICQNP